MEVMRLEIYRITGTINIFKKYFGHMSRCKYKKIKANKTIVSEGDKEIKDRKQENKGNKEMD